MELKERVELFTKQHYLVDSNREPPLVLTKKGCKSLSASAFPKYDILKIIPNIEMFKICDESICTSLGIFFGHVKKIRSCF